jgi:hypothetical protein
VSDDAATARLRAELAKAWEGGYDAGAEARGEEMVERAWLAGHAAGMEDLRDGNRERVARNPYREDAPPVESRAIVTVAQSMYSPYPSAVVTGWETICSKCRLPRGGCTHDNESDCTCCWCGREDRGA